MLKRLGNHKNKTSMCFFVLFFPVRSIVRDSVISIENNMTKRRHTILVISVDYCTWAYIISWCKMWQQ